MRFAEVCGVSAYSGQAGQFEASGAGALRIGLLRLGCVATAGTDEPLSRLAKHGTKLVAQHAIRATNDFLRHALHVLLLVFSFLFLARQGRNLTRDLVGGVGAGIPGLCQLQKIPAPQLLTLEQK